MNVLTACTSPSDDDEREFWQIIRAEFPEYEGLATTSPASD